MAERIKSTRGKCDIESARLGFEVLASALNDARYNSCKTIEVLRERNAHLEAGLSWLQEQIRGHCALLTGHSEHAEAITDCLSEVRHAVASRDQRIAELLDEKANLVTINRQLRDRPDLGDRARSVDALHKRIAELEHRMSQIKDALDELSIGAFELPELFTCLVPPSPEAGPDEPVETYAIPPDKITGIYEQFAAKIHALGDWSTLREKERRLAELEARLAEAQETISGKTFYDVGAVARAEEREAIVEMLHNLEVDIGLLDGVEAAIEAVKRRAKEGNDG